MSHTWTARFITASTDDRREAEPSPALRRVFALDAPIRRATLNVTAHGLYEAFINGRKVGDAVLAPGWTSYHNRLLFQTFDVTEYLTEGDNVLGAVLADGWWAGRIGFEGGQRNYYGTQLALLAQLDVELADGSHVTIGTDDSWQAAESATRSASIYDGEHVDFRTGPTEWQGAWPEARTAIPLDSDTADYSVLQAQEAPLIRVTETLRPASITRLDTDRWLLDFGQNLVGRLRIRVDGPSGQVVTIRHAEVLENGELAVRPLRLAAQTDSVTLAGAAVEWAPSFTFHGFRYAEISGWPEPDGPAAGLVVAEVIHTDMERTGWFETDNDLVNQLHKNVVWSIRGNAVGIPTDCPQRDERLGWTGDAQLFAPTAVFLYDCRGFFESWLRDLALEQRDDGFVQLFVPTLPPAPGFPEFFAAAWGDAAVVVPWALYEAHGDPSVLAAQYLSMQKWVDALSGFRGADGLWRSEFQFGDWLDPAAPPDNPAASDTSADLVANAYLIRSADLIARTAEVLGNHEDAQRYRELASDVRAAWNRAFVDPIGRIVGDTVTTYSLAIVFDLLPSAELRSAAGERLVELVRDSGHHITTGFVGTPIVCDALTLTGNQADAGELLLQQECPSWLYPVTMGATTIWERWDSMLPDGSVNPGEMTSFNHYALGAVASWLHRVIGGLDFVAAPTPRLVIDPRPIDGIGRASTRRTTPYGTVSVDWVQTGQTLDVTVEIPEGLTATVPSARGEQSLGAGSHRLTLAI